MFGHFRAYGTDIICDCGTHSSDSKWSKKNRLMPRVWDPPQPKKDKHFFFSAIPEKRSRWRLETGAEEYRRVRGCLLLH